MSKERTLEKHFFVFNKQDHGGESLSLASEYYSNGDPGEAGVIVNQKLILNSYCNLACFELTGYPFSPEGLRALANELEAKYNAAVSKNSIVVKRFLVDTKVVTLQSDIEKRKWSDEANKNRKFGVKGKIVEYNTIGNFYVVKHGNSLGCYDHGELMVI